MNWDRWPDRDQMTPEAMARDLERHPDIKAELLADQFAGPFCVACGGRAVLFATPMWFSPCPHCLAARMRRRMDSREELPWWVEYLAVQCERTASSMEDEEHKGLSVDFAPFLTCHRCGRLVPQEQARYVFPGGTGPGHAHCVKCWEASQREPG